MKCLFSGSETTNCEHIIPKWLQKKFDLSNQTFYLPNGTTLPYNQIKIPVNSVHNSNFGKIETNISQNTYNLEEIYLWAFKIHLGLIFKDSTLKFDRTSYNSPFILNTEDFDSEIKIFRHLYNIWLNGGTTNPSPLGSVFILDSFYEKTAFDFFHCFKTGTIGINIGEKFILVFLWDQGAAEGSPILDTFKNQYTPLIHKLRGTSEYHSKTYLAYHVLACETAYLLYRNQRPFNMMITKNYFSLIPSNRRIEEKKNCDEYKEICRSFGLKIKEYNENSPHIYEKLRVEDII